MDKHLVRLSPSGDISDDKDINFSAHLEGEDDSITITIDNLNFEDAKVNKAKVEIRLFHYSDRVNYKSVEFDIN